MQTDGFLRLPPSLDWRRVARLTLLAFVTFPILACRGGDGRPREEGPIVLRFLEGIDPGGGWQELARRFEAANPGIEVEVVAGPPSSDTRQDLYTTAFLAGESTYDLVSMDVVWVAKLAAAGWLLPLEERLPVAEREAFLAPVMAASWWDGHLWRVPMTADAGLLYYRRDLVAEAPATAAGLARAAAAAQRPPELWGFVYQGREYEGLVCDFLELAWGFGGRLLDDDGGVVLDSPEAAAALAWWRGTLAGPRPIAPPGVTTYQEEEARHLFQEGRAVFMRNWPYAWSLLQADGSPVAGKVGIAPMVHGPGGESAATLGGFGFGISAFTEHPEEAWRFIRYATSEEGQRLLHLRNGFVPSRRALFTDPEIVAVSPHYPRLREILERARPRPVHPAWSEISDALQRHVSAALVGQREPAAALAAAAREIEGILAR
jgi:multiple sugar transport system substrate-binding protein